MNDKSDSEFPDRYNKYILALETLVRIVTVGRSDSILEITLDVHGLVISGKLVSIMNYHKYLKDTVLKGLQRDDDPVVYDPRRESLDHLESIPPIDEKGNFILTYICIKDPIIFGPTLSRPPYWIGKMESVDGFYLGLTE